MNAIYSECRRLANEFEEQEKKKIPNQQWRREEGDLYLCREAYDELQKKVEQYYRRLLDERSQRVPK